MNITVIRQENPILTKKQVLDLPAGEVVMVRKVPNGSEEYLEHILITTGLTNNPFFSLSKKTIWGNFSGYFEFERVKEIDITVKL